MGLGAGVIIDPLAITGRGGWVKDKCFEPVENLGGRVAARKRRTSILQVEKLTRSHLFFKDLAVNLSDPAKFPMSCRSMRYCAQGTAMKTRVQIGADIFRDVDIPGPRGVREALPACK